MRRGRGRPEGGEKTRLTARDIDDEIYPRRIRSKATGSLTRRTVDRWLENLEGEGVRKIPPAEWGLDAIPGARSAGVPLPIFLYRTRNRPQEHWTGKSDWIERATHGLAHSRLPSSQALLNVPERQRRLDWLLWEMARLSGFLWPETLIVDWFCDRATPSREELVLLAVALDLRPKWLITGEGASRGSKHQGELSDAIGQIDIAIRSNEAIRGLPSDSLADRLRGAMLRRGVLREGEPISAGFKALTGNPDWLSPEQIAAGVPENPERLESLADQCLVPRAWLMGGGDSGISLVRVIAGIRGRADARKISAGLRAPEKPSTRPQGREPGPGRTARRRTTAPKGPTPNPEDGNPSPPET